MLANRQTAFLPPPAARNVPAGNRTTAVGIVTAASYAGTALAFGVSPWIISNFGWEVRRGGGGEGGR